MGVSLFSVTTRWVLLVALSIFSLSLATVGVAPEAATLKNFIIMLVAGVGFLLVVLPIEISVWILFLYLGLEGGAKVLSRYHPLVHVAVDLLLLMLVARVIFTSIWNRRGLPQKKPPLTLLLAVHLGWFFVVFFNPFALGFLASLAGAKLYVIPPLLFFFGYYLLNSAARFEFYLLPLAIAMVGHVITGLYQAAIGPKSVLDLSPVYGQVLKRFEGYPFRPFGLTNLPGGPAVQSYLVGSFLLYLSFFSRNWLSRFLALALLLGITLLLLFCQVKSALIKFIVGLLMVLVVAISLRGQGWSRRKLFLPLLLVLLSGSFLIPKLTGMFLSATKENPKALEKSLEAFDLKVMTRARKGALERFNTYVEMAPLGAGLSRIGPAVTRFQEQISRDRYFSDTIFFADNFWVQVVIDLGIPGVVILTLILLYSLRQSYFAIRAQADPRSKLLIASAVASIIGIVMGLYGAESILYNPEAAFFWFFLGGIFRATSADFNQKSFYIE